MRSLHDPQGRWAWQEERLWPLLQHWPLGGLWNPSQKTALTQRSPPQLQTPDLWALTFRHRHGVFQDGGQAQSPPRSPHPHAHRTWSGVNILIAESKQSCLNIISAGRIEKSKYSSFRHVWLFVTTWIVALQPPLSMEFCRQEYWIQLPFPSPGDLPDPEMTPVLLHCMQILYHLSHQGKSQTRQRGLNLPCRQNLARFQLA